MKRDTATARAQDPVAMRLHERRKSAGLTLAALARAAAKRLGRSRGAKRRPGSVSASYLCLIEAGRKVPDEAVAVALAEALGDDPRIYRAWVSVRKRADLGTAVAAADTLRQLLGDPDPAPRSPAPIRRAVDDAGVATIPSLAPPGPIATGDPAGIARLRIAVVPDGADPGDGVRPACEVLEWRGLDASRVPESLRDRLVRPFAYAVSEASLGRVPGSLVPAGLAIVTREILPLSDADVYAVRCGGRVVLSRIWWNGWNVLLLPAPGAMDFDVTSAAGKTGLRARLVGRVVLQVPPE